MRLIKHLIIACIFLVISIGNVYSNSDTTNVILDKHSVKNISAKGFVEGIEISWSIDYALVEQLRSQGYTISLRYNTSIAAENESNNWKEVHNIHLDSTNYTIENLAGAEKYAVNVGISKGAETVWSTKAEAETDRSFGFFQFFVLFGALGMFIYGMKIMSEGLQQASGARLRNLLGSMTSNRVKGVLTGFGITSIVQSSSVTTVMTVSFVNAGLLTLVQSAGVMMGANIGTTITAWLVNFFGFKMNIASYALVLIAFGAPLLFIGKQKLKAWGGVIIGFSLLFLGLEFLKENVPQLGKDSDLVQFFINYKDIPVLSTLIFVLLGALVTIIVQSSSAAMALTMTLVAGGIIPFEVAAAMILGENIGTTITAELASTVGNVHAKRSARIHTLFNVIGVSWAIIVFPFFLDGIAWGMEAFGAGNPFTDTEISSNTGLAIFHTAFNTVNVLIMIWFVPQLVRIAERTVKSKGSSDEEFHLEFIGAGIMGTPDLSLLEAKKEIAKFGDITMRMSKFTQTLLIEKESKGTNKLFKKIRKYEEITDRLEIEVVKYLNKISEGELTEQTASRIQGMNSIVNDLERVGDIYYQMSKTIERKQEEKAWFSPEQRNNLIEMFALVDKAFAIMNENLFEHHDRVTLDKANAAEKAINKKRDKMRKEYLASLSGENLELNMRSGLIYNELFSSLEKVGDHIINVSEAVVGKI